MVAISQPYEAQARARPFARAEAATSPNFAPGQPMVWVYGRIVYADERQAPKPSRFVAFVLRWRDRLWYELLGQPRLSLSERPALPDKRATRGSRAEVRAMCRDEFDFIYGDPFGAKPFGDEIILNPTLCRPLWAPHRAQDAEHAAAYTTTLADFICPELQERARTLTRALEVQTAAIRSALEEDEHD